MEKNKDATAQNATYIFAVQIKAHSRRITKIFEI